MSTVRFSIIKWPGRDEKLIYQPAIGTRFGMALSGFEGAFPDLDWAIGRVKNMASYIGNGIKLQYTPYARKISSDPNVRDLSEDEVDVAVSELGATR